MSVERGRIVFRPTSDEDLPGLSDLFDERFGHQLEPEDWLWKYRQLPGEGRSMVAVDAAGALLAHAGAISLPAVWRGRELAAWQLTDWVGTTRGGGLRPPLVELGRRLLADLPRPGELPWVYGFPSRRHFRLGQRVFGYRPLTTFRERVGDLPLAPGVAAAEEGAVPSVHLESGDVCGDWAEECWRACRVDGVRRTAAFLNWRYHARPGRYYRVFRIHLQEPAGERREGCAVFAFIGDEAAAVELWLPGRHDWRPALAAIGGELATAGLARWRFWPPPYRGRKGGGGGRGLLDGLGLYAGGEVFVGYRQHRTEDRRQPGDPPPEESGFTCMMGDHDIS